MKANQDLRKQFIDTLCELAEKDDKVCLIIMDVGFSFVERFKERFPERLFDFGITEPASMVVVAGLALEGMKPYIYSMRNFVSFRVHEQLRNAVCMHKANVKIVGVTGSEKYAFLGFSHNNLYKNEDIDFIKRLPNIKCYQPKTEDETAKILKATYKDKTAAYITL